MTTINIRAFENNVPSRGKDFAHRELQSIGDELALLGSNDERRSEQDVVAAGAVNGALRRVGKDIFLESSLADFFGDAGFLGERLAREFVFYEFDGLQKTETPDLADVRMRLE